MFPYPSGAGLHIGHAYNYAVIDSYCRWLRYKGERVFQPFGYDAFGLPVEMYAKKVGRDPADVTRENIKNFRAQMQRMNTQYQDILITCDQSYYCWSQWLFTQMRERGLAYKASKVVPYDPHARTVLANEQVDGDISKITGVNVEYINQPQWFFRITDYRDRLIGNLNTLDYPASTIKSQRYWLSNLNDWCVSRQRSWGTPIPIEGETDTLDTFVDSSFYFLRYLDPENTDSLVAKDKARPVDLYVGGSEHACAHLIYARFVTMFLYDIGVIDFEEPFKKVVHQGIITRDGHKMSKSFGNSISPDQYDPDELRLYLMFIGPYTDGGDWNDKHISGVSRFLKRMKVWLSKEDGHDVAPVQELENAIAGHVQRFKFNRVVSDFMTFLNNHRSKSLTIENKRAIED